MSPSTGPVDLDAAERFLRLEARLLDLRRYERAFHGGPVEAVAAALSGYRNADGGYAGILEPDLRTTVSQPQAAELALRVLDECGTVPVDLAAGLCDWLGTVTGSDGGVPFTHPSARVHPAAPHWHHADGETSSLNPTAALVGLLHRHGIRHPWLDVATAFCWRALAVTGSAPESSAAGSGPEALDLYSVRAAAWLLDPAVPDPPDPDGLRARLADGVRAHVAQDPALTAPGAEGHHIGPLEVAPFPDSPLRALLPVDAVEAALDALQERQRPDGGWEVNFAPISSAATAEWRAWATLQALLVLRAAGRL
ncbi:hypothetical protein [Patulibacter sp.]|uniref:hypothetical protein n=1 Tax=Patulibacter sp. TaxID=1912859 RepID=UPI002719A0A4|nr:hypothetical protein [Patulibacter sp.]MDO9407898.1 hypothetical protein [Patulibacter sp.]